MVANGKYIKCIICNYLNITKQNINAIKYIIIYSFKIGFKRYNNRVMNLIITWIYTGQNS